MWCKHHWTNDAYDASSLLPHSMCLSHVTAQRFHVICNLLTSLCLRVYFAAYTPAISQFWFLPVKWSQVLLCGWQSSAKKKVSFFTNVDCVQSRIFTGDMLLYTKKFHFVAYCTLFNDIALFLFTSENYWGVNLLTYLLSMILCLFWAVLRN